MKFFHRTQLVIFSILSVTSCSGGGFSGDSGASKNEKTTTPTGANSQPGQGQPVNGGTVPTPSPSPLGGNTGNNTLVTKTMKVHFQRVGQNDAGPSCAIFQSNAQTANVGCNYTNTDNWTTITVHPATCNFFTVSMIRGTSTVRSTDNVADVPYINFVYSANQFIVKINDNNDSTDPNDLHHFADFYYKIEFFEADGVTPATNIGVKNFPNAGCQQ